ncbi:MAG: succinate dehydrogenase/fumarate reductase iron-sulfur subunit, partial [Bdellovibrionales bacterium]|jgi:succinate dehydrogenase / fumarate reductase iron-sulfur subunit|nr:succinate dehydrogenase/fumarate reductase iron-sulfur subunit [Bdellovibrionales bacterium]
LKVWRQKTPQAEGYFEEYEAKGISTDASFLEMHDVVNNRLVKDGKDPIAFDHDCREGICGSCSMTINGNPHGPDRGTATCQLHMRRFCDGDSIVVEPFRAKAFPVLKDLAVDRSSFDNIIAAGGYVSVNTGNAPDANSLPVPKDKAELAFKAAACIGCGACVAACSNSSAMLFVSAKVAHLGLLPQGEPERDRRVLKMMQTMEDAGFGNCSNTGACSLACPKEISFENIASLNKDFLRASLLDRGT